MKKLLLLIPVLLTGFLVYGQDSENRINLKSGEVLKCSSITYDSINQSLNYVLKKGYLAGNVGLDKVGSYVVNGVTNAFSGQTNTVIVKKTMINGVEVKDDSPQIEANSLVMFANNAQTGIGIMLAGTLISASPWFIKYPAANGDFEKYQNTQKTLAIVGTSVSLVGLIVFISSFDKARDAGYEIPITKNVNLSMTGNGLGVSIPINK